VTRLGAAINRLPKYTSLEAKLPEEKPAPFTPPPAQPNIGEGSFFVRSDRTICQVEDGDSRPVIYGSVSLKSDGTMTGKRLAGLIGLRDLARRVLQSQNEGWPDADRNNARRELNLVYDRFALTYGPINKTSFSENAEGSVIRRMPNVVKFREDPDAMLVLSLEEYDEATGKAAKSAIMQKDVVGTTPAITKVATAEEGLLVALDQRGTVDLEFISSLYGKKEDQIIGELGSLIYEDPESKTWETADVYLSGNVRTKLAAAALAGPRYQRNKEALIGVQPEDVLPGDIDANLGAPWIPEAAGLPSQISPHSFRVATVTDLLSQGVPLGDVQYLAGHADPRTTRLYDRRSRVVSRNMVERISI
jgi:N12 class adenine-specific DNA methylase